jgi:hypothetical protein
LNKVWHIAHIKGKNHKQELYKFPAHYRAMPQSFTWKAPAEVLFWTANSKSDSHRKMNQRNLEAKAKQKAYKDAKTNYQITQH